MLFCFYNHNDYKWKDIGVHEESLTIYLLEYKKHTTHTIVS